MGWINRGKKKIMVLDGRRQTAENTCFEDLKGGVGLKRVWEFVPKAGKKRNERVKVSSDS